MGVEDFRLKQGHGRKGYPHSALILQITQNISQIASTHIYPQKRLKGCDTPSPKCLGEKRQFCQFIVGKFDLFESSSSSSDEWLM